MEAPSRHRRDSWPSDEVVGGFFFDFEADDGDARPTRRWDTLLERVVLNSGAGALVGLAASLVLSRGRTARWAITFFGAGTGVGMAVERSSAEMSAAEREK